MYCQFILYVSVLSLICSLYQFLKTHTHILTPYKSWELKAIQTIPKSSLSYILNKKEIIVNKTDVKSHLCHYPSVHLNYNKN